MPIKPHRVIIERVSAYADEAATFVRRRKADRRPFARVHSAGGTARSIAADTEPGKALFRAAARVLEAARPRAE